MPHRIHIHAIGKDTRAEIRLARIRENVPSVAIESLHLVDNYTVSWDMPRDQLEKTGAMLTQPAVETYSLDKAPVPAAFAWSFEIGYLPGVTDNVGHTAHEGITDLLKRTPLRDDAVFFSQTTFVAGDISPDQIKAMAALFYNPLIQHADIRSQADWQNKSAAAYYLPEVHLPPPAEVMTVDLDLPEPELLALGRQGILDPEGHRRGPLALDKASLAVIRDYFKKLGRSPTDIELESIAQTWSEHCKHTIFAAQLDELTDGLYKTYIKAATEKIRSDKGDRDFCVSVFKDNSGAILFDDEYLVTDKVETHNSPCALDPFGGSITGIVGVNRDAMGCGLGAKPIINRYGFCFADPRDKTPYFRDEALKNPLLSARRIMDGVVYGVNVGGNCSGIPTPQGFVTFDPRYRGKPLVFVGTVGLLPRQSAQRPAHEKAARDGDVIVMAGGRVGRDGIHGATFSSEVLSAGSPATAVQIGDPITQKKMSDAIVKEARDQNLYSSITDNGAGGLSCSVAEMARECGGCHVDLDKVPVKYPGLEPWQIWVSESQERMTFAVPPEKCDALLDLLERRGVEATAIGTFNTSGRCTVSWHGQTIMDIDLDFLHDGLPRKVLTTKKPAAPTPDDPPSWPDDLNKAMLDMMARPNITSFAFISRQYDHEVQGGSVLKPLAGPGEVNTRATVSCPIPGGRKGVALSQALFPSYGDLDPYAMASCAVDAAVRQVITCGGSLDHLALMDNTCWCSSDDPVRLWQLKQAIKACHDWAIYFGAPFISGKDSMFNDFSGFDQNGDAVKISVPPTLLVSSIGVIENVAGCVSMDFKQPGDVVYLLGETREELGGSEFLAWWGEASRGRPYIGSRVPTPSDSAKSLYKAYEKAVAQNLVTSAESIAAGGLAVALARQAIAARLGVRIDLPGRDPMTWLFSETASRMAVTVHPDDQARFEAVFQDHAAIPIGRVTPDTFTIVQSDRPLIQLSVDALAGAYHSTFLAY